MPTVRYAFSMATLPAGAISPVPSMEAARAAQRFWEGHWVELLHRYPDQYVAVVDGKVVASNLDAVRLDAALAEMSLRVGTGEVWVRFVSSRLQSLLL